MRVTTRRLAVISSTLAAGAASMALAATPAQAVEVYVPVMEHCVGLDSEGGGKAYEHPTFGTVYYPAPYFGGASECN